MRFLKHQSKQRARLFLGGLDLAQALVFNSWLVWYSIIPPLSSILSSLLSSR